MKDNTGTKNHQWKNGQGELLSRCWAIIKGKKRGKTLHKKITKPYILYFFQKTIMSFIA